MKIVILGGGIVGVSCALELTRAGHQVIVVEKCRIGHGCSFGNAGWMTPCFAFPLPMPGMFLKATKWLLQPSSPLYIKPEPSVLLAQWMFRFLRSMNPQQAEKSIEALVKLSQLSLLKYEELANSYDFGFQKKGLLMLAETEKGLKSVAEDSKAVGRLGVPGEVLSRDQVLKLEPRLKGEFFGAVYYPAEAHAEPLKVVQALAREAQRHGATLIEDCHFQSLRENSQGKVLSVLTSQGEIEADQFILATGSWSQSLGSVVDLKIPILGGKGYSMLTPRTANHPLIPIMILEKKIAITPHRETLSIAGTLELVDQDFSISHHRVQAIVEGARKHLDLVPSFPEGEPWRGLRPCTPDGVPLIGPHPRKKNFLIACGHQMLGLQTGFGTGRLIASWVDAKPIEACYDIFAPARFES